MDTKKPGNNSVVPWSLVLAGFLIVPLVLVPGAEADHEDGHKDFESHDVLDTLDSGWLISTSNGNTNARVTAQNHPIGTRGWGHDAEGTGASLSSFEAVDHPEGCSSGVPDLSFNLRFHTLPTGTFYIGIAGESDPDPTLPDEDWPEMYPSRHQLRFEINETLSVVPSIHGPQFGGGGGSTEPPILVQGAAMGPLSLGTNYTFNIYDISCTLSDPTPDSAFSDSATFDAKFSITELEQLRELSAGSLAACRGSSGADPACDPNNLITNTKYGYLFLKDDTADAGEGLVLDEISWPVVSGEIASWCPDPGLEDFGYNYVEGVTFEQNEPGFGIQDFYSYSATSDNHDYTAKGWTSTPSQDLYTRATLEAATEGQESVIRFSFSFVDPTTFTSGDNFTAAAKGDGEDTGVFFDAYEAEFSEEGNDWRVVVNNIVSGSKTQVGSAWLGGDPNTPTDFEIGINSNTGEDEFYVAFSNGVRVIDQILNAHIGDPVYSMWTVGEAGGAVIDAQTAVNDNDGTWNSSCIFFNDLTPDTFTPLGSAGALPFNETTSTEPGGTSTPTGGIGSGIFGSTDTEAASAFFGGSTSAANFFFGALFIVGMAAAAPALTSGTRIDATPSMIGGGILGLVMGWAFGFISGTFMFVLVVLAVAGVGFWFWGRR